jgi:uncharacterized protein YkwD
MSYFISFLLLGFILVPKTEFAQQSNYLVSSQGIYNWTDGKYVFTDSVITIYDEHNNETSSTTMTRDQKSGKMVAESKVIYTYDEKDNRTSKLYQTRHEETGELIDNEKDIYEYNEYNQVISEKKFMLHPDFQNYGDYKKETTYNLKHEVKLVTHYRFDRAKKEYNKSSWHEYYYDPNANLIYISWSGYRDDGSLREDQRDYYSYDAKNNLVIKAVQQLTSNYEMYVDVAKETYVYDAKNNLVKEEHSWRNNSTGEMQNGSEFTFVFDGSNNKIEKYLVNWNIAQKTYLPYNREYYTYDSKNNLLTEVYEKYNDEKKKYELREKKIYTYDANGNRLTEELWDYNNETAEVERKWKIHFYYKRSNNYTPEKIILPDLRWTAAQYSAANTAVNSSDLSAVEKEAIMYINLARMYPKQFAANEVEDYLGIAPSAEYKESAYKKSLIDELLKMKPVGALQFDLELFGNAKCFSAEQGKSGAIGHDRKKCKKKPYAENCSYGAFTGKDIAMQWLIDHNVADLGHRINCLNPNYTRIGLSTSDHKKHKICAVAELN